MNTSAAYEKYIIKANKNGINDNVATDKGRFVELLYSSYLRYIEYILNNSDADRRKIQELLKTEHGITGRRVNDYFEFNLPKDFYDFSSIDARATKGSCTDSLEILHEIKDEDRAILLSDLFTQPSFEYRESVFILSDNKIKIFTNGEFDINSISITYYRYPIRPRLVIPDDPESDFDDSIELELQEKTIDRIIDVAVGTFDISNDNPRATTNIQRAISKI